MGEQGVLRKTLEALSEAVFPSNIYCACCGRLIDGTRPYALCDSCMKKMHWNNGRTCEKCGKALPETYRGVGNCILGYADGDLPAPKPRKENYIVRV